ncbi:MAG: RnfH family protein [Pseudomonadota bacterium]
MPPTQVSIEVAYANPERQEIVELSVPQGTTARDAVFQSAIADIFPEIDLTNLSLGIFSKRVDLESVLKDGDRIEIYRPLTADPKEIRRQRAAAAKAKKTGGRPQA